MAHESNPNDLYRANDPNRTNDTYRPTNPSRPTIGDDDLGREARLESELQADPELAEGPAGGSKIALFAVGIAIVLGAVFYGLNNTSMHPTETSPTAQNPAPATAQNAAPMPPTPPPGMRDVTPRSNTGPGVTTGAAPSPTPPTPPQAPADNAKSPPASK